MHQLQEQGHILSFFEASLGCLGLRGRKQQTSKSHHVYKHPGDYETIFNAVKALNIILMMTSKLLHYKIITQRYSDYMHYQVSQNNPNK